MHNTKLGNLKDNKSEFPKLRKLNEERTPMTSQAQLENVKKSDKKKEMVEISLQYEA